MKIALLDVDGCAIQHSPFINNDAHFYNEHIPDMFRHYGIDAVILFTKYDISTISQTFGEYSDQNVTQDTIFALRTPLIAFLKKQDIKVLGLVCTLDPVLRPISPDAPKLPINEVLSNTIFAKGLAANEAIEFKRALQLPEDTTLLPLSFYDDAAVQLFKDYPACRDRRTVHPEKFPYPRRQPWPEQATLLHLYRLDALVPSLNLPDDSPDKQALFNKAAMITWLITQLDIVNHEWYYFDDSKEYLKAVEERARMLRIAINPIHIDPSPSKSIDASALKNTSGFQILDYWLTIRSNQTHMNQAQLNAHFNNQTNADNAIHYGHALSFLQQGRELYNTAGGIPIPRKQKLMRGLLYLKWFFVLSTDLNVSIQNILLTPIVEDLEHFLLALWPLSNLGNTGHAINLNDEHCDPDHNVFQHLYPMPFSSRLIPLDKEITQLPEYQSIEKLLFEDCFRMFLFSILIIQVYKKKKHLPDGFYQYMHLYLLFTLEKSTPTLPKKWFDDVLKVFYENRMRLSPIHDQALRATLGNVVHFCEQEIKSKKPNIAFTVNQDY